MDQCIFMKSTIWMEVNFQHKYDNNNEEKNLGNEGSTYEKSK